MEIENKTRIDIGRIWFEVLRKQHDYRSRGDHEIDPLHHIGYLIYIIFYCLSRKHVFMIRTDC